MLQAMFDIPQILRALPFSTVFILALSLVISLATTLVNRRLTDPQKSKEWRKEISDFQKELRAAQKSKDKKTLDKVMKKQQYVMQLQSKMMWQSMKVSLLFIVPLFLMWQILGGFYGSTAIAFLPGVGSQVTLPIFNITLTSLFWWYLLSSLFFGTAFQHLFGLIEVTE